MFFRLFVCILSLWLNRFTLQTVLQSLAALIKARGNNPHTVFVMFGLHVLTRSASSVTERI